MLFGFQVIVAHCLDFMTQGGKNFRKFNLEISLIYSEIVEDKCKVSKAQPCDQNMKLLRY